MEFVNDMKSVMMVTITIMMIVVIIVHGIIMQHIIHLHVSALTMGISLYKKKNICHSGGNLIRRN